MRNQRKKSMVREVYTLDVMEEAGFVQIRVSGNGFLHNMVRKNCRGIN